ncbi:uncharacterized protein [Clytia hemisphaerica]|uniref:Apple domain-containing protein n=1 Tax=Clytia hemisphaerica TaxID=252671 RepID=A0A7M5X8R2_9CNID|eukprot:TCONS_00065501-protein
MKIRCRREQFFILIAILPLEVLSQHLFNDRYINGKQNKRLVSDQYLKNADVSEQYCMATCSLMKEKCKSINYHAERKECVMNKEAVGTSEDNLIDDKGWRFYPKTEAGDTQERTVKSNSFDLENEIKPEKNQILHFIPVIKTEWKLEVYFQIKDTGSQTMEMFSFRNKETTGASIRAVIKTQPNLKLTIEVYGKVIELPITLGTDRWYKLDVIQHRLMSHHYSGYKVMFMIDGYLEVDERLPTENVTELRDTEVYSCHHLQKSCLRGRIKKFRFRQTASSAPITTRTTLETLSEWNWPWWVTFQAKIDSFLPSGYCGLMGFKGNDHPRSPWFGIHGSNRKLELTLWYMDNGVEVKVPRYYGSITQGVWYFMKARIEVRPGVGYYFVLYIDGNLKYQVPLTVTQLIELTNVNVVPLGPWSPCYGASVINVNYGYLKTP